VITLVFAVHQLLRSHDLAAERRPDRLMAQADAQDRQFAGEVADGLDRNPGFGRRTGPGETTSPVGWRCAISFHGDLVVAKHLDLRAKARRSTAPGCR